MQSFDAAFLVQGIEAALVKAVAFTPAAKEMLRYAQEQVSHFRRKRTFVDGTLEHMQHVLGTLSRLGACVDDSLGWVVDQLRRLAPLRDLRQAREGRVHRLILDLHDYAAELETVGTALPSMQASLKARVEEAEASIEAYEKVKALDCTACYTSFPDVETRRRHQTVCKKHLALL